MKKPTVTIRRPAYCALGGVMIVLSLIGIFPAISAPTGEKLTIWMCMGWLFAIGLIYFVLSRAAEIIDENGIYFKGVFKKNRLAWSDIIEVGVAKLPGTNRPVICITVKGGKSGQAVGRMWHRSNASAGYCLPYRRKVWDCIRHYYGEPDFDEWGKPPTVS